MKAGTPLETRRNPPLLRWTLGFIIFALIAVLFGFGKIALEGSLAARICFSFFILGFAFALIWSLVKRRKTPPLV